MSTTLVKTSDPTPKLASPEVNLDPADGLIILRAHEVRGAPGQRRVLVPEITIVHAGKLTPGWMEANYPLFCREIQRAQVEARTGLRRARGEG